MRRILALAFTLLATAAIAQTSVRQTGSVTPGHVATWTTNGVIGDGGTAGAGKVSGLGVVNSGPGICQQSAQTGAYNLVCLNATSSSGGLSMTNIGGATGGFTFTLNGTTQGIATVTLPVNTNDFVCFADTTGTLKDCGAPTYANPSASVGFSAVNGSASSGMRSDAAPALSSSIYNTSSVASTLVERDANQNAFANNWVFKATNVVSAGTTTTLTAASTRLQTLTGSANQTFQLPDATTLSVGTTFEFNNNSTGTLTVVDAASGGVSSLLAGGYARVTAIAVSTTAGSWDKHYLISANGSWGTAGVFIGTNGGSGGVINLAGSSTGSVALQVAAAAGSGTVFQLPATNGSAGQVLQTNGSGVTSWAGAAPTVQSCASGLTCDNSSHTYTATAGTVRVRIQMCGGGAGGAAVATNGGGAGSATSFGSWVANGGTSGGVAGGAGGAGGSGGADGTGTKIFRIAGNGGMAGMTNSTAGITVPGGSGGNGPFGGLANAAAPGSTANNAAARSCAGGLGGGGAGAQGSGSGGGAGEYVAFWATAAQASGQSYTVGNGGTGGAAGTVAGGNGGSGNMIIEEFAFKYLVRCDAFGGAANDNVDDTCKAA